MKSAKYASFFAGTLFLATGVLAGPVNKRPLHLYESLVVEGKQLPPGDYKVEWSEPGPDVKVSILQGKDTVATVSARVVALTNSTTQDSYATRAAQDGSKTLTQLFFGGKKYELDISGSSAGAGSQTAASQQN